MPAMHIPIRSCVVCRSRREQAQLVRLIRTTNGFVPDLEKRAAGRGIYICPDRDCIETKKMKRFFKTEAENMAITLQNVIGGLSESSHLYPGQGVGPQQQRDFRVT